MPHPTLEDTTDSCYTSLTHREREICTSVMSSSTLKSTTQQEGGREYTGIQGKGVRQKEMNANHIQCGGGGFIEGRKCGLTVKPMPTVAVKDPGMNLPWSY